MALRFADLVTSGRALYCQKQYIPSAMRAMLLCHLTPVGPTTATKAPDSMVRSMSTSVAGWLRSQVYSPFSFIADSPAGQMKFDLGILSNTCKFWMLKVEFRQNQAKLNLLAIFLLQGLSSCFRNADTCTCSCDADVFYGEQPRCAQTSQGVHRLSIARSRWHAAFASGNHGRQPTGTQRPGEHKSRREESCGIWNLSLRTCKLRINAP